jgi:hypothetical protein
MGSAFIARSEETSYIYTSQELTLCVACFLRLERLSSKEPYSHGSYIRDCTSLICLAPGLNGGAKHHPSTRDAM